MSILGLEVLFMPEFTRNEITISYTDEGAGRPVVLLHGHTLDRRIWLPVVPHPQTMTCPFKASMAFCIFFFRLTF